MKKLEIMLDKDTYRPGEKIEGQINLNLDKGIKAKDITVDFYGEEETHITIRRSTGKSTTSTTYRENVEIINEGQSLIEKVSNSPVQKGGKVELSPRKYTIPFSFTLPKEATPSYDGSHVDVQYRLSARVDIPWRIDIRGKKMVAVVSEEKEGTEESELKVQKKSGGNILPQFLSPDVEMNVSLDKSELKRGEELAGKVSVVNKSEKQIRKIILELYANEHAKARRYERDSSVMSHKWEVPIENFSSVQTFDKEFNIKIPEDVIPTLKREYFSLDWFLKVRLDIAKAKDVKTETKVKLI